MEFRALCSLGFVCGAAFYLPSASAASSAGSDTTLNEIVVTAQKREERLEKVPISIAVLSAETLETVNADGLDAISQMVPSLSVAHQGRGSSNVQIRGLGSNVASVSTIAIYNDGIISPDRAQGTGQFAEQDASLFDVERVEVLRGPQGTLYGEGSLGGVINIISKHPDPNHFDAGLSTSWYDIKGGAPNSNDVSAMVNLPVIDGRLAVRLVGFESDRKGWLDAYEILPVFLGTGGPTLYQANINDTKVSGGRFLVGYTQGPIDATLIVKRQVTQVGMFDTESDYGDILHTSVGNDNNLAFIGGAPLQGAGYRHATDEASLEANWKTGAGTVTSVTGWGQTDKQTRSYTTASDATGGARAWSEELRYNTTSSGPFNWTSGAYFRNVITTANNYGGGQIAANTNKQWSVFGQMYLEIMTDLHLTAGLRYEKQDNTVNNFLNAAQLGAFADTQSNFSNVSPKAALDWQLAPNSLVYVSVAKGFRAGGANIDYSLGTDSTYNRSFNSDSTINYELGEKISFMDKKVTVNTAVFYIDWHNIQIDHPIHDLTQAPQVGQFPVAFIVTNGDKAHSYGVETDVYLTPGSGWDITLGGTLMNAQFDDGSIVDAYAPATATTPAVPAPLKGNHLASAPTYMFNASAGRTFPLGSSGLDGKVRADYSLRGSSFADVPNVPDPNTHFSSGPMHNVNLRAAVLGSRWEVQGFVTNLANSSGSTYNYQVTAPTVAIGAPFLYRNVQQPRTIGINVKLRYR